MGGDPTRDTTATATTTEQTVENETPLRLAS
jgi:hypothetical protein